MPTDATSLIQPLDQDVFKNLKKLQREIFKKADWMFWRTSSNIFSETGYMGKCCTLDCERLGRSQTSDSTEIMASDYGTKQPNDEKENGDDEFLLSLAWRHLVSKNCVVDIAHHS